APAGVGAVDVAVSGEEPRRARAKPPARTGAARASGRGSLPAAGRGAGVDRAPAGLRLGHEAAAAGPGRGGPRPRAGFVERATTPTRPTTPPGLGMALLLAVLPDGSFPRVLSAFQFHPVDLLLQRRELARGGDLFAGRSHGVGRHDAPDGVPSRPGPQRRAAAG